ncbi:MAG: hypothetical protein WBQ48_10250, partial [Aeromicrobium sp.]
LSAGAHDAEAGEACVMEYVSLLAGEHWSDRPDCTHPILAHEARTTNDLLMDTDRPRLIPLIGRLFGTTADSPAIRTALRLTQAHRVADLVDRSARARIAAAITATPVDPIAAAFNFPIAESDLDPEHHAHHVAQSRIMAFALSPDLDPAEAHALYALSAAHKVAAGECQADCGNGPARARRMVRDLTAMIDAYDEITDRAAVPLPVDEVRQLIAEVR